MEKTAEEIIEQQAQEIERLQKTLSRYSNQEVKITNQQQEIERLKEEVEELKYKEKEFPSWINVAGFEGRFKTSEDAEAFLNRCIFYQKKYGEFQTLNKRISELEAQLKGLIPFLQERIRRAYVAIESKTEDQSYPFDGRGEPELKGMHRAYSDVLTTIQSPKEQPEQKVDSGQWQDIMTTAAGIDPDTGKPFVEQPEAQQQEQNFRKNCYIGTKVGCHCTTECEYDKLMKEMNKYDNLSDQIESTPRK